MRLPWVQKSGTTEAIQEAEIAKQLVKSDPAFTAHLNGLIESFKKAIENAARAG